jgi:F0F1-type ATP synthase assembly protein I
VTHNGVRHEHRSERLAAKLVERRALNQGFGNAMAFATELALTPLIFGGAGWLLDRWLDTSPVCTIAFAVFAFAGMLVRAWIGYDTEMRRHENDLAWNRGIQQVGRKPGREAGA